MTSAFMSGSTLEIQSGLAMKDIESAAWNRLVSGQSPFIQHEFLLALEQSGSVSAETGWEPCHLAIYENSQLIAAMPLYIKHHSYGEYVFDWAWADAWRRHGLAYYPKLLTAIPFTPSQSPRLLISNSADKQAITQIIYDAVKGYAEEVSASSWHVLFPDQSTAVALDTTNLIRRESCQFHWQNRAYQSFDDFLATCSSRKRKTLRKERKDVAEQGFIFTHLCAEQITPAVWDRFYVFYQNTYQVRGQHGYLSRDFFTRLHALMPSQVFLVLVSHPDSKDFVAGAMFLTDEKNLYGRYWGCEQDYQNLHFETCYYQGIDICIARGLERFDAGAQGEHKLRRGFEPVTTCSYHWIQHEQFSRAVRDFCEEEALHTRAYKNAAKEQLPFRKSGSDTD